MMVLQQAATASRPAMALPQAALYWLLALATFWFVLRAAGQPAQRLRHVGGAVASFGGVLVGIAFQKRNPLLHNVGLVVAVAGLGLFAWSVAQTFARRRQRPRAPGA